MHGSMQKGRRWGIGAFLYEFSGRNGMRFRCVFRAQKDKKKRAARRRPRIRLCVQLFSAAGAFSPFLMKLTAKTRIERNIRPLAIR